MRDPRGRLSTIGEQVVRTLTEPLPPDDFLHQPLARELVRDKLLVDFAVEQDARILSPRVGWVSQPSEWSRAQLLDAALLTLDVAERATARGFELKDASSWNVIFDGSLPVFCDHLSFAPIRRREWHAFGQFARHFTLPLLVAARSQLPVHSLFRVYRDGITPELALSICGWRAWFSRAAPLMLAAKGGAAAPRKPSVESSGAGFHANLLRYCRSSLPSRKQVTKESVRADQANGGWRGYTGERSHYSAAAVARKHEVVSSWLARRKPGWVLDLGANTGEFSVLAARAGARVIAVDADHHCIERLYLDARAQPDLAGAIHPVVAQLDDLCAGRGWGGSEAPGIVSRLRRHADVVMLLGLVHHLAIACAIPLSEVAAFAASMTRDAAIVEVVAESDPMFEALASQYDRSQDAPRMCGRTAQLEAFGRCFDVVEQISLPDSHRTLLWLVKRPS